MAMQKGDVLSYTGWSLKTCLINLAKTSGGGGAMQTPRGESVQEASGLEEWREREGG